jgi:phosphatidate cytidylyltransferase
MARLTASPFLRRLLVGVALIVIVVAAACTPRREPLTLLVAAWSVLATLEFCALLRLAEVRLNQYLTAGLNAALVAAGHFGLLPGFLVAPVAIIFIWAVATRDTKPRNPVYGVFAVIYLGLFPAHLLKLRNLVASERLSFWLVLAPLVLTWVSDTAAYAVGRLLGRHPLAPQLSPKKTVEGFVAGLLASGLLAAAWLRHLEPFSLRPGWWLTVVGIGLSAAGQAGDLFESIFKRAVSVKDSSTALGEHGGFLDRADSLLFAIPAFYYVLLSLTTL